MSERTEAAMPDAGAPAGDTAPEVEAVARALHDGAGGAYTCGNCIRTAEKAIAALDRVRATCARGTSVPDLDPAAVEAAAKALAEFGGDAWFVYEEDARIAITAYLARAAQPNPERVKERDAALVEAWTDHEMAAELAEARASLDASRSLCDKLGAKYTEAVARAEKAEALAVKLNEDWAEQVARGRQCEPGETLDA